jgi:quercetin dioxygenase-like cupin family protein
MPTMPDVVGTERDAVFYARGSEVPVAMVTSLDGTVLPEPMYVKVLFPGPKGSLLEFRLSRGQTIPSHRFAHDFINYLVSGRVSVALASHTYEAETRDAWAGAAGVEHSITALEDSVMLEWMSSPHILAGSRLITWGAATPCDSHLFTRWKDADDFRLKLVEGTSEFGPPGVDVKLRIKVLVPGPFGSLLWGNHRAGKFALHAHQHTWICYLIRGRISEKFGGTRQHVCEPGDVWAAQIGAEHCTVALADPELVEFKWPAPMMWQGILHSWEAR